MKIGYARVSTVEQNLEAQEDALNKAGCDKIFTDKQSGTTKDRPGLLSALEYIRPGDTLVVWRLDRLARSTKDLISMVSHMKDKGIDFHSINEGIETQTMNGKLVFHIFAALSEFERDLIIERTKRGLEAARSRGIKGGARPKLSAEEHRRLKELYKDHKISIDELVKMFGISRSSIFNWVKK